MSFGGKKNLILGLLMITLVGLPLVTYFAQRPQENRSRASASTTLYFSPNTTTQAPLTKNVGDIVSFDVFINPGTNLPSVVKLDLVYDPAMLQPETNPFTVNTAAFPNTIEGPIIADGHLLLSVTIGSDSTKAVQSITKVGTVNFKALSATATPIVISFGSKSQVLSIAGSDESTENVLSTTSPAYLSITNPYYPSPTVVLAPTATPYYPTSTPSPTATPYPTPTSLPTPTPTTYYPPTPTPTAYAPTPTYAPTATPYPTLTVAPTPTLVPYATTLSFDVLLHGIGSSGDNANPAGSTLSNKSPHRPSRSLEVTVYDNYNNLVTTATGTVIYDSSSGSFKGTITLGTAFSQGLYSIKIKEPTHLRRLIPGIITITPQINTAVTQVALTAGDINGDNIINVADYNLLLGCYSDLSPAVSCDDVYKITADLNDDGYINQHDYNLFLREVTVQTGS